MICPTSHICQPVDKEIYGNGEPESAGRRWESHRRLTESRPGPGCVDLRPVARLEADVEPVDDYASRHSGIGVRTLRPRERKGQYLVLGVGAERPRAAQRRDRKSVGRERVS